jgi:hypothetical protein
MDGWIKIYRTIRDHWIWDNPIYFKAWIAIILNVNHEDSKVEICGELIECNRGQSLLSLKSWSKFLGKGWTIQKVRTFFNLLKNDSMINIEGLHKTTRLTVCNYDIYQDMQQANNTQITSKQHADNTQITSNKNDKKEKNNIIPPNPLLGEMSFIEAEYKETFGMWLFYKKNRKQKYKDDKSIELCYKRLLKISNNSPDTARLIVEQSMANNWSGLFELKQDGKNWNSDKKNANEYALEQYRTYCEQQKVAIEMDKPF